MSFAIKIEGKNSQRERKKCLSYQLFLLFRFKNFPNLSLDIPFGSLSGFFRV
jgi:hypothetical protein